MPLSSPVSSRPAPRTAALGGRGTLLAGAVLLAYFLPWFVLGEGAWFNAFDNLDSFVSWYRVVVRGGYAFAPADTPVPEIMGVPKHALVNVFSLFYGLNLLLPTFQAVVTHYLLIHLTAFFGMRALLRRHLPEVPAPARLATALSFALLPYYQDWNLSIAAQPLVLSALLALRARRGHWADWLVVAGYPFVSNLQSVGIFVLAVLGGLIVHDGLRYRRAVGPVLLSTALLAAGYLLTKADMIETLVLGRGSYTSHRIEMVRAAKPLWASLRLAGRYFVVGDLDASLSIHSYVLLPTTLIGLWYSTRRARRWRGYLLALLGAAAAISVYIAVLGYAPVIALRNAVPVLRMFMAERFHVFLPLIWHLAFAGALAACWPVLRRRGVVLLGGVQLLILFLHHPTYHQTLAPGLPYLPYHHFYRYGGYYSEALFAGIDRAIGLPKSSYKVASVGFPPAIAQYNGFHTIDGYCTNYPLDYKHAFRRVNGRELDLDTTSNAAMFDEWGNQCYLVDNRQTNWNVYLSRVVRPEERRTERLEIDPAAFRALGGRFIFSVLRIEQPERDGLRYRGRFLSDTWEVFLYEVP
jgi:hypothetical protein